LSASIGKYLTAAVLPAAALLFTTASAFPLLSWAEDNGLSSYQVISLPASTFQDQRPPQASEQHPLKPSLSPENPEGKKQDSAAGETEKPFDAKAIAGFFDLFHGELSKQIVDTATWMDSFFADPSFVKEENRSYVRFRFDIFKEERAKITLKPAFNLRLALPQLEKKTHLVLSAEPAQPANDVNAPVQTAGERFGQSEQRNLTTAIHYLFRSTAQESFFMRTGIQFSKLSPVILVEPRYRVLFPFSAWNIRFTQDVLWKSNTSWQTDTRFDFERLLPYDSLFFRTSIDGIWAAKVKGYIYSLSFSLQQPLAPTHALDYVWINTYQTRPVGELTEIAFLVRYRHSFLREWLFFEISPQVRFPRTSNFRLIPGVLFRFEMFFGGFSG
jgi:hypothetical protein